MHQAKSWVGFDGCLLTITKAMTELSQNQCLKYSLRGSKQQRQKGLFYKIIQKARISQK